jgi:hypothetical protein
VKQTRRAFGVELTDSVGDFHWSMFRVDGLGISDGILFVMLLKKVSQSFDDTHRSINKWSRVFLEALQKRFWNFDLHERILVILV